MPPTPKDAAATAKTHLDALNRILVIPLPILLVLGAAIATRKSTMSLGGIELELDIARLAAMAITGFALLTAARHAAVIGRMIRDAAASTQVRDTLESHVGALNPFFRLQRDPALDGDERVASDVLHSLPKLSVGLLIGFVLVFHPDLSTKQRLWTPELQSSAVAAAVLFLAGCLSALAMIGSALAEMKRRWAIVILLLGVAAGSYIGFRAATAIGAAAERAAAKALVSAPSPAKSAAPAN